MKFADLPTKSNLKDNRPLEMCNAVIGSVSIGNEDHGCVTAWLHIKWGASGCGFGGYKLGEADGDNTKAMGYLAEFVNRCIRIGTIGHLGKWEDLRGCPIRILHEGWGGSIIAIGHFIDDEWFCPKIEWKDRS